MKQLGYLPIDEDVKVEIRLVSLNVKDNKTHHAGNLSRCEINKETKLTSLITTVHSTEIRLRIIFIRSYRGSDIQGGPKMLACLFLQ